VELDATQALFLDGIRHASELGEMAYDRLMASLEAIARRHHEGNRVEDVTEPFLYAWAFVDAVDRLRQLVKMAPGFTTVPRSDGEPGFLALTEDIRSVRNVSDHLGQRADYVVASNGAALGVLQWVTPLSRDSVLSCSIRPGRLNSATLPLVTPPDRELEIADCIAMRAGQHLADLSRARTEAERVTRNIEEAFISWIGNTKMHLTPAPGDIVVVAELRFTQSDASSV